MPMEGYKSREHSAVYELEILVRAEGSAVESIWIEDPEE